MKSDGKTGRIINRINGISAVLAAAILAFVMLIVSTEVVTRSVWNYPITWVIEISEYCLLFITFLAAAWVLQKDRHVSMVLVLNRFASGTQVRINIVTSIIAAIICLAIVWYGAQTTWTHFQEGIYRPSFLQIPNAYTLFIIPLGCLLLFVQFLRRIHGYWRLLKAPEGED